MNEFPKFFIYVLALVMSLAAANTIFYRRLSRRMQLCINMASALVSGFALLIALAPRGQQEPTVAIFLFLGILAVIKWMTRFENPPRD